jgi:molybdopterin-guanine dinucleotide biosynthesis protein A
MSSSPFSFPSQTGHPLNHPLITELKALESVLRVYFYLGAPHWIPAPQDHHPLAGVDTSLLEVESYAATVLACATPGFLVKKQAAQSFITSEA